MWYTDLTWFKPAGGAAVPCASIVGAGGKALACYGDLHNIARFTQGQRTAKAVAAAMRAVFKLGELDAAGGRTRRFVLRFSFAFWDITVVDDQGDIHLAFRPGHLCSAPWRLLQTLRLIRLAYADAQAEHRRRYPHGI